MEEEMELLEWIKSLNNIIPDDGDYMDDFCDVIKDIVIEKKYNYFIKNGFLTKIHFFIFIYIIKKRYNMYIRVELSSIEIINILGIINYINFKFNNKDNWEGLDELLYNVDTNLLSINKINKIWMDEKQLKLLYDLSINDDYLIINCSVYIKNLYRFLFLKQKIEKIQKNIKKVGND